MSSEEPLIGIYALLREDRVVYVGLSNNIKSRIRSHKRENTEKFEEWKILELCELKDIIGLEKLWQKFFNLPNKRVLEKSNECEFCGEEIERNKKLEYHYWFSPNCNPNKRS